MASPTSQKPTILAVDDQPVILHTVTSELKHLYQIRPFTSGKTALRYLADIGVADLILLDYEMPDMNGIQVLRALRADPKTAGIPAIFLTGSDNGGTEVEVLEEGAADYIQKPIKARVLLTRVRMQLELARYRNHMEALVREQTEHLRRANEQLKVREDITLSLLAEATDMRDHDTGGHINRVTEIVRVITTQLLENPAEGYTLTQSQADDIIRSARLHDLGKIGIPDHILLKPGRLDAAEFDIVKKHPRYSADLFDKYIALLGEDSFLDAAREIALCHHEKWDGSGYPAGLRGREIPLSARITALADVYDALTSMRPYKAPLPHDEAARIILESSGSHFDPVIVQAFEKNQSRIARGK